MGVWTELRFPREGHQRFGHERSDIVAKIVEIPHPKFKRQGNDIIYSHKISLLDSLKSVPIHFTTIDNEMMEVSVDEVISPQSL
jgi:DnaJ-class molecular chaperone